jgi:PAS domain S-box-containing protein
MIAEPLLSLAVSVAAEHTVQGVLNTIVRGLAAQPHVALARIWLLSPGDICDSCFMRAKCPDQTECLHLMASSGNPTNSPGEDWTFLRGHFRRMPLKATKIGEVGTTENPILIKDFAPENHWIARPDWARREGIRSFAGHPLVFQGKILGVLALFSREPLVEQESTWIGIFAKQAVVAIANARSFEEIARLRHELELENDYLHAEIAERKNAERALLSSEGQLKQAQAVTHLGSYEVDVLTGQTRWSDEMFRILGLDPARGSLSHQDFIERIVYPEDQRDAKQRYDQAVHEGQLYDLEYRVIRPDGSLRSVQSMGEPIRDADGTVVRLVGALLDITDRRQTEEALREAQAELAHVTRVATLGELTTSIAHEINQPLAAVVNNASACLRWLAGAAPNLEEARQSAALIIADGHRAGEIISRIRALANKAPPQKDRLNINETILEVIALARSQVQGNHVALKTQLSDELPLVLGDRIQLQQVILNLVMNGIEAMSAVTDRSRDLLIRSGRHEPDKVLVAVQDSGIGLKAESLDHLFEAFFTTKPKGMGMGLAISRSIIETHGGRLWAVPNDDGPGAAFQFTLLQYH